MKIGIIGASTVGMALAVRFNNLGHEVLVANSRGRDSLRGQLADIDVRLTAASVTEASDCEVVFLAIPWPKIRDVLTPERDWGGRILVEQAISSSVTHLIFASTIWATIQVARSSPG